MEVKEDSKLRMKPCSAASPRDNKTLNLEWLIEDIMSREMDKVSEVGHGCQLAADRAPSSLNQTFSYNSLLSVKMIHFSFTDIYLLSAVCLCSGVWLHMSKVCKCCFFFKNWSLCSEKSRKCSRKLLNLVSGRNGADASNACQSSPSPQEISIHTVFTDTSCRDW